MPRCAPSSRRSASGSAYGRVAGSGSQGRGGYLQERANLWRLGVFRTLGKCKKGPSKTGRHLGELNAQG